MHASSTFLSHRLLSCSTQVPGSVCFTLLDNEREFCPDSFVGLSSGFDYSTVTNRGGDCSLRDYETTRVLLSSSFSLFSFLLLFYARREWGIMMRVMWVETTRRPIPEIPFYLVSHDIFCIPENLLNQVLYVSRKKKVHFVIPVSHTTHVTSGRAWRSFISPFKSLIIILQIILACIPPVNCGQCLHPYSHVFCLDSFL